MTAKESEALKDLQSAIRNMSEKLFGNGTRHGCIDERLEHVEGYIEEIKNIMPTIVTRTECKSNHETQWSKRILYIGMIATWLGLVLRVMGVI